MNKIKFIFVNICIAFLFAVSLYLLISMSSTLRSTNETYLYYSKMLTTKIQNPNSVGNSLEEIQIFVQESYHSVVLQSIHIVVYSICIFICVFLFVYCNPALFRRSTWTNLSAEWAKNKQERAAARQAKEEERKQKRIESLETELQELKKDDVPPSD